MARIVCAVTLAVVSSGGAFGQGIVGDVFSGKLVKPEVGVWSWYELKDAKENRTYFVRMAIVGEEEVGKTTGYWLEVEVAPQLGFRTVYKMLVTGPASDPANVHKILYRKGSGPVQEAPVDISSPEADKAKKPDRKRVAEEEVQTPGGAVKAVHYVLEEEENKCDLWLNDTIPPMGVVRMSSPEGDLVLQNHGKGGKDALSAIEAGANEPKPPETVVEVGVEKDEKAQPESPKTGTEKEKP